MIDLASAKKVKDIQVGPHLSHPEGIADRPEARPRLRGGDANQDLIAVIDLRKLRSSARSPSSGPQGIGTAPVGCT